MLEVIAERKRQDRQWGGPEHDDEHGPDDWVRFINRHAAFAIDSVETLHASQGLSEYRRRLVQVAALALAAVKSYDRHDPNAPRTAQAYGS